MKLEELLEQWREGTLEEAHLRELLGQLEESEGRARLREDWFLEAGLPEALRAGAIERMTPAKIVHWKMPVLVALAASIVLLIGWSRRPSPPVRWVTVAAMTNPRWADSKLESSLRAGEVGSGLLRLEAGKVEFQLLDGATVLIEGPAAIRFTEGKSVLLESGKLYCKCPTEASRITVTTAQASIVDLGTEFAVEARPDESTRVAVMSGVVKASEHLLRQGEAVTVRKKGPTRVEPLNEEEFHRLTASFAGELSPAADAANRLIDPGFEQGLSRPWRATEGSVEAKPTGGRSGGGIEVHALGNKDWPQVMQEIPTGDISGKVVGGSVWAMTTNGDRLRGSQCAVLKLVFTDADGRDFAYAVRHFLQSASAPETYHWAQVLAVAPPGTRALKFQLMLNASAFKTGTVCFDDAQLSISPNPAPPK